MCLSLLTKGQGPSPPGPPPLDPGRMGGIRNQVSTHDTACQGQFSTYVAGHTRRIRIVKSLTLTHGHDCDNYVCIILQYTIVHNNPSRVDYAAQSFTWQAPSTPGVVDFL